MGASPCQRMIIGKVPMKAGNSSIGSSVTPLPSWLPLQPPTCRNEMHGFSTLDKAAESTRYSWLNADSESQASTSASAALKIAAKRAEKARVQVDWLRGSMLELPVSSETIDFVTDRGLFHLIEDHDRPRYAEELFRVLKNGGLALIRGASGESPHNQFNAVTKVAIDRYFSSSKFKRGPVLPIPLLSVEGSMDARIVMLQKRGRS